jgi:enoyl-CoA hydratase/carnithine racemase
MPQTAEVMIHDPWSLVIGGAGDMRKEADHLDSLKAMIANIYANKTGIDIGEINQMMETETWMDGEEAVELGFADKLLETSRAAACAFELDLELLPGLPEKFINYQNALKKRANEKNLRDAGNSRAEAKAKAGQRDAGNDANPIKTIVII